MPETDNPASGGAGSDPRKPTALRAFQRGHLEIDRSALENPDCIREAGLVVRAYAGRMHDLDWEGTYLWNAHEMTWLPKPYVLAATPDGIYDAGSVAFGVARGIRRVA